MSDDHVDEPASAAGRRNDAAPHVQHPSAKEYMRIFFILGRDHRPRGRHLLRARHARRMVPPDPVRADVSKFALVVLWFMHLKFDDRRYRRFFVHGPGRRDHALPDRPPHVQDVFWSSAMNLPPWHAHLDVWLLFGSIVAAYLIAVRRHARETGRAGRATHGRGSSSQGVAVLWLGADWPIHDLAERYLYLVHMVAAHAVHVGRAAAADRGHAGLAPPRGSSGPSRSRPRSRFLTRPLVALIVFNAALLFVHWPAVVELSVRSELGPLRPARACWSRPRSLMWWPVMSPLPEYAGAARARADALPVPAVARPDHPGLVPDVRRPPAVPGVRDVPADLGHRRADRPAHRRD